MSASGFSKVATSKLGLHFRGRHGSESKTTQPDWFSDVSQQKGLYLVHCWSKLLWFPDWSTSKHRPLKRLVLWTPERFHFKGSQAMQTQVDKRSRGNHRIQQHESILRRQHPRYGLPFEWSSWARRTRNTISIDTAWISANGDHPRSSKIQPVHAKKFTQSLREPFSHL